MCIRWGNIAGYDRYPARLSHNFIPPHNPSIQSISTRARSKGVKVVRVSAAQHRKPKITAKAAYLKKKETSYCCEDMMQSLRHTHFVFANSDVANGHREHSVMTHRINLLLKTCVLYIISDLIGVKRAHTSVTSLVATSKLLICFKKVYQIQLILLPFSNLVPC